MDGGTTPDLQLALQLSAQMVEAAQAADWERAAGLQSTCAGHLHSPWPASVQTHDALQVLQEQHLSVLALAALDPEVGALGVRSGEIELREEQRAAAERHVRRAAVAAPDAAAAAGRVDAKRAERLASR